MKKTPALRPIDKLFTQYSLSHQNPVNKLIHWFCVPLIMFSLLGLVWSAPFPYLSFLGKYNGFVNWATFLIAFAGYYYYRLSPVLCYAYILLIFAFSAGIVGLEKLRDNHGWPQVWVVCLGIFILSWIGQFIGHKIEGKKPSFLDDLKFLLVGPLWLLHFVFKKFGVRY
ncbi:DUF962 domain-containing protein [Rubrolithibacter danxiaensis]|uniref:Mpo1 family 2-hydroxy fatty acid dioxygenase n=1 Tax=Rubrolithibacter danxiaensis TaxID=3390805 RepID=UPI003BF88D64